MLFSFIDTLFMRNLIIIVLTIVLHISSCSSNHRNSNAIETGFFNLGLGETIVVTSSAFGCTHHEHFRATIKHISSRYQARFESIQDSVNTLCEAGFLVRSVNNEIWDSKQYESFIRSIKTDTSKRTTSFLSYVVRKGSGEYTFMNTTGENSILRQFALK
jgi:hypothetical protein